MVITKMVSSYEPSGPIGAFSFSFIPAISSEFKINRNTARSDKFLKTCRHLAKLKYFWKELGYSFYII